MGRIWLGAVLMAGLGVAWAQFNTPVNPASNPVREPEALDHSNDGFGGVSSMSRELQERQLRRLRALHQQELMTDTERLLKLATSLKDEVDQGNSALNADVLKDADEIAKLAKRVSERIKTQ